MTRPRRERRNAQGLKSPCEDSPGRRERYVCAQAHHEAGDKPWLSGIRTADAGDESPLANSVDAPIRWKDRDGRERPESAGDAPGAGAEPRKLLWVARPWTGHRRDEGRQQPARVARGTHSMRHSLPLALAREYATT